MSVFRHGERWRATGYDRVACKQRHLGLFDSENEAKVAEARWYRTAPVPTDNAPRSEDTTLYRAFDENASLLYVGIAGQILRRLHQHEKKNWWIDVAEIQLEHFPTREAALEAETLAIQAEAPAYNLQQNGTRPDRPRPVSFKAEKRELVARIQELEGRLAEIRAICAGDVSDRPLPADLKEVA